MARTGYAPPKEIWVARAEREIVDLLAREGACVPREIEARLADRQPVAGQPQPIQPHILTTALGNLVAQRRIVRSAPTRTRGGREIAVYHLPIVSGANKGFVEDAAARKRLLQTRFFSWAVSSSKYPYGFIGPAGNRALHAALTSPELSGRYALVRPDGGDVTHLFDDPVVGGPLDSAAVVMGSRGGVAAHAVYTIFEVKNIRHWIYQSSWELYQLLHKAAVLQNAHPETPITPVLVCRKRHFWAREMAVDLGFYLIEVLDQYVLPTTDITETEFEEVRTGLGYMTLVRLDTPPARLVKTLHDALLRDVLSVSERWKTHGSTLEPHYAPLRDKTLGQAARSNAVHALAVDAGLLPDMGMRWTAEDEDPFVDPEA